MPQSPLPRTPPAATAVARGVSNRVVRQQQQNGAAQPRRASTNSPTATGNVTVTDIVAQCRIFASRSGSTSAEQPPASRHGRRKSRDITSSHSLVDDASDSSRPPNSDPLLVHADSAGAPSIVVWTSAPQLSEAEPGPAPDRAVAHASSASSTSTSAPAPAPAPPQHNINTMPPALGHGQSQSDTRIAVMDTSSTLPHPRRGAGDSPPAPSRSALTASSAVGGAMTTIPRRVSAPMELLVGPALTDSSGLSTIASSRATPSPVTTMGRGVTVFRSGSDESLTLHDTTGRMAVLSVNPPMAATSSAAGHGHHSNPRPLDYITSALTPLSRKSQSNNNSFQQSGTSLTSITEDHDEAVPAPKRNNTDPWSSGSTNGSTAQTTSQPRTTSPTYYTAPLGLGFPRSGTIATSGRNSLRVEDGSSNTDNMNTSPNSSIATFQSTAWNSPTGSKAAASASASSIIAGPSDKPMSARRTAPASASSVLARIEAGGGSPTPPTRVRSNSKSASHNIAPLVPPSLSIMRSTGDVSPLPGSTPAIGPSVPGSKDISGSRAPSDVSQSDIKASADASDLGEESGAEDPPDHDLVGLERRDWRELPVIRPVFRFFYLRLWLPVSELCAKHVGYAMQHPEARVWGIMDIVSRLLDMFYLMVTPVLVAFICDLSHTYIKVFLALDVLLTVSVFLDYVRPRYDQYGELLTESTRKRKLFFSKWTNWLELLSVLPADWFVLAASPYFSGHVHFCENPRYVYEVAGVFSTSPLNHMHEEPRLRYMYHEDDIASIVVIYSGLRAIRMLHTIKTVFWVKDTKIPFLRRAVSRLAKNLLTAIYISHWNGCVFWFLDTQLAEEKRFIDQRLTDHHGLPSSFIYRFIFNYVDAQKALFFLLREVELLPEVTYQAVEMLIAAVIYGSIFGNLVSIVRSFDDQAAFDKTIKSRNFKTMLLRNYLRENKFPPRLQRKILDQEEFDFLHKKGMDTEELFVGLPRPLRQEVGIHLYLELVNKVPLFAKTDDSFKVALTERITTISVPAGFYICKAGDPGTEMYFIRQGSVDIMPADESRVFVTLKAGAFFGEIALMEDSRRTATAKTAEVTQLCVLSKQDFKEIMQAFPTIAEMLYKHVQDTKEQDAKRKLAEAAEKLRKELEEAEKAKLRKSRRSYMSGSKDSKGILPRIVSGASRRVGASRRSILNSMRSVGGTGTGTAHSTATGSSLNPDDRRDSINAGSAAAGLALLPTTGSSDSSSLGAGEHTSVSRKVLTALTTPLSGIASSQSPPSLHNTLSRNGGDGVRGRPLLEPVPAAEDHERSAASIYQDSSREH
ncbi:hypothetical protein H9P43_002039 [Blastocladiella emersonii ATCC 22665]|nr:hypothetical protein H9P43_002039 [Blastocladiella emersonii ATCC 22665]